MLDPVTGELLVEDRNFFFVGDTNPCLISIPIGPNASLPGTLEPGDCQISGMTGLPDETFVDQYVVTLAAPGTLTVTMRSGTIDSFLYLLNVSTPCAPSCDGSLILATDDDSGGGVNGFDAQIVIPLGAGTYTIFANSFEVETGSYTLETTVN